MTVQEIQEIGFEKAVFGGYDMKSVDTFLERVAEEFATMQKENAALKAKMKVLVDKIDEYRGVEEGMRRTLMSAQTIAQDTIDKAKQEAETLLAKAREESDQKVASVKNQLLLEQEKLETARKQTLDFIARVSSAYQSQNKTLVELARAEHLVRMDGQPLDGLQAVSQPLQPAEQPVKKSLQAQPVQAEPAAMEKPLEDATHKFDFGELKFGTDYDAKTAK